MKCTDIVKENKRLKVENEVLKQKVKILKDAINGALVSMEEMKNDWLHNSWFRSVTRVDHSRVYVILNVWNGFVVWYWR